MKANKKNILEVLNSSVSTSELSRKTGIAVMTLSDLRNRVDDSKIDKMQFRTAAKLQKYWEELQIKNKLTADIKEIIRGLELDLAYEMENRTETNYNGMAISTCKRRLESAKDALHLFEIGELTKEEAEDMVADSL